MPNPAALASSDYTDDGQRFFDVENDQSYNLQDIERLQQTITANIDAMKTSALTAFETRPIAEQAKLYNEYKTLAGEWKNYGGSNVPSHESAAVIASILINASGDTLPAFDSEIRMLATLKPEARISENIAAALEDITRGMVSKYGFTPPEYLAFQKEGQAHAAAMQKALETSETWRGEEEQRRLARATAGINLPK